MVGSDRLNVPAIDNSSHALGGGGGAGVVGVLGPAESPPPVGHTHPPKAPTKTEQRKRSSLTLEQMPWGTGDG